jgi:hypothetical protein
MSQLKTVSPHSSFALEGVMHVLCKVWRRYAAWLEAFCTEDGKTSTNNNEETQLVYKELEVSRRLAPTGAPFELVLRHCMGGLQRLDEYCMAGYCSCR